MSLGVIRLILYSINDGHWGFVWSTRLNIHMTKHSNIRFVSSAWSIQHGQPIRKTDTVLHDGVSDYENPHTQTNCFTATRCVVSSSSLLDAAGAHLHWSADR